MKKKEIKGNFRFQFITHANAHYDTLTGAKMALEGGCRWVQLRMKDADYATLEATAIELRSLCDNYNATMIIDDNVALAKAVGADGVHLGLHDMPIAEARQILGTDYIIGGTANTFEDICQHYQQGADYIGCGPFRYTKTKKNLSPILGIVGYDNILRQMRRAGISIPIVAIGGIVVDDIHTLMLAGLNGVALSGCVLDAASPTDMAKIIVQQVNLKAGDN